MTNDQTTLEGKSIGIRIFLPDGRPVTFKSFVFSAENKTDYCEVELDDGTRELIESALIMEAQKRQRK